MEEEEEPLDSVDVLAVLSLVDSAVESDFESPEDLAESSLEEDELSLEPFLFSDGGLGRP